MSNTDIKKRVQLYLLGVRLKDLGYIVVYE